MHMGALTTLVAMFADHRRIAVQAGGLARMIVVRVHRCRLCNNGPPAGMIASSLIASPSYPA